MSKKEVAYLSAPDGSLVCVDLHTAANGNLYLYITHQEEDGVYSEKVLISSAETESVEVYEDN